MTRTTIGWRAGAVSRLVSGVVMVGVAANAAVAAEAPTSTYTVGPTTTVIDGPLRADGSIDYVAALNERLREGVTADNNAFVDLAATLPPDAWPAQPGLADYRQRVTAMLDAPIPEGGPALVSFEDHLAAQALAEPKLAGNFEAAQARPWTPQEFPHVAAYLEAMAPALERAAAASRKPRYYAPLIAPGASTLIDVELPMLRHARTLCRALVARAQRRVKAGRLDAAWDDVMVAQRLARLISTQSLPISDLVGRSMLTMTNSAILSIAASGELTPEQAQRMTKALRGGLPPFQPNWRVIDVASRWETLDLLGRLVQGGELHEMLVSQVVLEYFIALRGKPDATDLAHARSLRKQCRAFLADIAHTPDFDADAAMIHVNQVIDRLVEIAQAQSYSRQRAMLGAFERAKGQRLDQGMRRLFEGGDPAALGKAIADLHLGVATAGLGNSLRTGRRSDTFVDLQQLILALGGHHAEHGRFPDDLADLVPQFLPAPPTDRFTDGQPLHYRAEADTAIVHSVGGDGDDDGGVDRDADPTGFGDVALSITRPPSP